MLSCIAALVLAVPAASPSPAPQTNLSLGGSAFVRNAGQWPDAARYRLQGEGLNLWLTDTGAVIDRYTVVEGWSDDPSLPEPRKAPDRIRGHAVGLEFVGASPARFREGQAMGGRLNFFLGNDPARWARGLDRLAGVEQLGVYPGVDVVWSRSEGSARFDFRVEPGADAGQIALRLSGASSLCASGDTLLYGTQLGELELTRLHAYQVVGDRQVTVPAQFIVDSGGVARFRLGAYDRTKPLVIDPLVAATYLGGLPSDAVHASVDLDGWTCHVGHTGSPAFPVTFGAYDISFNGATDAFMSVMDSQLTEMIGTTYVGGSGAEHSATASWGVRKGSRNLLFFGATESSDFPTSNDPYDTSANGGRDGVILALSETMSDLFYSTYLGGTGTDRVVDVAGVDPGTCVILSEAGAEFPTTAGAYDTTHNGGSDAALTTLSTTLKTLHYSTYLGGASADLPRSVHVRSGNQVIVTGQTLSSDFPKLNGPDLEFGGTRDGFVTMLSPVNAAIYSSFMVGGSAQDGVIGSALRGNDLFLLGWSTSTDYFTTPGVVSPTRTGSTDGTLTRIRVGTWTIGPSTYLGGFAPSSGGVLNGPSGEPILAAQGSGTITPTPGAHSAEPSTSAILRLTPDFRRYSYASYVRGTVGAHPAATASLAGLWIGGTVTNGPTTEDAFHRQESGAWIGEFLPAARPSAITLRGNGSPQTTHYWTAPNGTITGWRNSGTIPAGWVFGGHGDINGDERDDLVVMRTSDGAFGAYILSATGAVVRWQALGRVPAGWRIAAVADYNCDGDSDIFLERNSDKAKGVWIMRGTAIQSWTKLAIAGTLIQVDDIDGNGWADLVALNGDFVETRRRFPFGGITGSIEVQQPNLSFLCFWQADSERFLELLYWDPATRALVSQKAFASEPTYQTVTTVAAAYTPVGVARLY